MKKERIIVKTEEGFELARVTQKLVEQLGGFGKDIIREYVVKDLTSEEAFDLWYNQDKITCAELQYVKELRGE